MNSMDKFQEILEKAGITEDETINETRKDESPLLTAIVCLLMPFVLPLVMFFVGAGVALCLKSFIKGFAWVF